jgi:CMP-N,N'-diacetyllegionaminic acid synthase
MPRTIAVIPARGGSRSIPRKNLVDLGGKPLIAHMIEAARQVPDITDLIVSTEDQEIGVVAKEFGANVPFVRPLDLAGDDVESLPVVQHAVNYMEDSAGKPYDYVVLLQATAPLCLPEDIENCLARLKVGDCQSVVTCVRVTTAHPFRMKRVIGQDVLINFIDQGFEDMRPRQKLPPVYKRSGAVYASKRDVVMEQHSIVGDDVRAVIVPEERGIDIDSFADLMLAKFTYEHSLSRANQEN